MEKKPEYPPIDGFLLSAGVGAVAAAALGIHQIPALRCNLTFKSLVLEQYECLRRAGGYRAKQWCVPQDSHAFTIPARNSYEYELQLPVGSVIWGSIFTSGVVLVDSVLQGYLTYQVTDACNNVRLISEFVTKPSGEASWKQQLLSKLYTVGAPGLLKVEIANTTSTDRANVQLILCGGTPGWNEAK